MNNYELHSHVHTFDEKGNEKHLQCQLCPMKNPRLTPTKSNWEAREFDKLHKAILGAIKSAHDAHPIWFESQAIGSIQKRIHEALKPAIRNLLLTQRQELILELQEEVALLRDYEYGYDKCQKQVLSLLQSKKQPKND